MQDEARARWTLHRAWILVAVDRCGRALTESHLPAYLLANRSEQLAYVWVLP